MREAWISIEPSLFAAPTQGYRGANRQAETLLSACLAAAALGDSHAYFDLGVAFASGSHGVECDVVEAHKWFNLASVAGHGDAAQARADLADEMTAREIAEAQRRAREWLRSTARHAA